MAARVPSTTGGLRRAGENGPGRLDHRERLDDPIDRFSSPRDLILGDSLEVAQPVEGPQAFNFQEGAGNARFDGLPLTERPPPPKHDAQDDRGVEVGDHRAPRS